MYKVNNKNTRARCEVCSKLTVETPEPRLWLCSDVFIVDFEHISYLALGVSIVALNSKMPAGNTVYII